MIRRRSPTTKYMCRHAVAVLSVHQLHHVFRVAQPRSCSIGEDLVNAPPILGREFYVERTHVLFEIPAMLRSRNGHDIFALRQHPGQRQLRRLNALLFCDFSHPPHQIKILLEILSLKTGRLPPVIVFGQVFESFELTGKKSTTQRTVRNEPNSQLSAGGENLVLGIARPEGIFGLQGSDGMNLHSSSQRLRSRFREPDMADFAFLHELRHCAYGLFNWRIRIDAMLVVQVDTVYTEAPQTSLARFANVFRLAVYTPHLWVGWIANNAEFCGDHNLIALAFDGFPDQFLVGVWPVRVRCIEKSNTEFERTVNGGNGFIIIASTVEFRHAHAAETEGGDLKTGTS